MFFSFEIMSWRGQTDRRAADEKTISFLFNPVSSWCTLLNLAACIVQQIDMLCRQLHIVLGTGTRVPGYPNQYPDPGTRLTTRVPGSKSLPEICWMKFCFQCYFCTQFRPKSGWHRLANRPVMAWIVPELTHGVPCTGRGSFCPGNVKIDHRAWMYGCSIMIVLYFVLCLSVTHDLTWV